MISNQTVINAAIATNIAARAIHNTKVTRISHNKTNKFRYNPIVENRYNRIKHNILRKHLKSNQKMPKFIAINIFNRRISIPAKTTSKFTTHFFKFIFNFKSISFWNVDEFSV